MALDVSYGLLAQFMIAGALGLLASHLWVSQYAGNDLGGAVDTCKDFIEKTKLLKSLKLGTMTPYQVEVEVTDESYLHSCQAVQVRTQYSGPACWLRKAYHPFLFQIGSEAHNPMGS